MKTLVILLFMIFIRLNAEKMQVTIEFKGLKVADVELNYNQNQIDIMAKSTVLANVFSYKFENRYIINKNDNYLPKTYIKKINQHNFKEDTITTYNFNTLKGGRKNNVDGEFIEYRIFSDTRDFFSALYYLRTVNLRETQKFTVDNVGRLSTATSKFLANETIKTPLGQKSTIKVEISFEHIDERPSTRSDILTHNLVKPENTLIFWFTDDEHRIPIRAIYTLKFLSVNWLVREFK